MTSNTERGGRRTAPYAFTEQGFAMLSSVLDSQESALAVRRPFGLCGQWLSSDELPFGAHTRRWRKSGAVIRHESQEMGNCHLPCDGDCAGIRAIRRGQFYRSIR